MRAPAFWWHAHPSLAARLLRPFGLVYGSVSGRRLSHGGVQAELPVICIGNFTAGGAGKTPSALAIAQMLDDAGESPAFLSRGYGGKLRGPVCVELHHLAADVGDEPILLASMGMAIVSRDRPAGAQLAHEFGATALIMDDGLQNPSLNKDCAIAVVDAATGIGNGEVLPAGPLRAPMQAQWSLVDALLIIGAGSRGNSLAEEAARRGKRVFRARLAPDTAIAEGLRGQRVLAFAGIGRPEKFFETLRECGAIVMAAHGFPDHHPYSGGELSALRAEAERLGLEAITTEKDMVRIVGLKEAEPWPELMTLPVRLVAEDETGLRNFILRRINERRLRGTNL